MRLEKRQITAFWLAVGIAMMLLAGALALASPLFGYDMSVRDMPVFWLTGGLVLAGLVFLILPWLVRRSETLDAGAARGLFFLVVGTGLVMRAVLFASEPVLEDDYQRYLWDGAVTAHGLNPYAIAPEAARSADPQTSALGRLAVQAGPMLDRINHPELRTIYPPVSQGVFALAYTIEPFSLTAWRGLVLIFDIAALGLLLVLLRDLGRSPLWVSLYWWNPVVLKELFNSAHMDAIVVPLVLAGLVLAARGRLLTAGGSILLAAGAKIWPLLLLPLIWRPLAANWPRAMAAAAMALFAALAFAAPILVAGLDQSSGLVVFAEQWKTNSALFPALEQAIGWAVDRFGANAIAPGVLARLAIALALAVLAARVARKPFTDVHELTRRAVLVTAALFLLSPVQFPWYFTWVLPLMALRPVKGLLLASATLPLYYAAFFFLAHNTYPVFTDVIVWFVWIPVWVVLLAETGIVNPGRGGWPRASQDAGQAT